MEIKGVNIKSMKYDAFNDNEYIEQLRAGGVNVVVGKLDQLINWGRSNSLWPLTFATSCCGIEFMAVGAARYDFARFGFEVTRASPRQADVIVVAGTIVHKMAPVLKRLYDQMAEPKYVIAMGAAASSIKAATSVFLKIPFFIIHVLRFVCLIDAFRTEIP